MSPIQQWIQDHGITFATVQRVPANPNMAADDWAKAAFHYWAAIDNPAALGEPFQTYYSVGPGIVETWAMKSGNMGLPPYSPGTVAYAEAIARAAEHFKPDLADILETLAMDSRSMESVD